MLSQSPFSCLSELIFHLDSGTVIVKHALHPNDKGSLLMTSNYTTTRPIRTWFAAIAAIVVAIGLFFATGANPEGAATTALAMSTDSTVADTVTADTSTSTPEQDSSDVAAGRHLATGEASFYGPGFAGRPTASGETFNPAEMTAAHRSLPFGTKLRVTNRSNGKSVIVRVNDRGPYAHNRILDLSKGAAQRIGMVASGTANVDIAVIS